MNTIRRFAYAVFGVACTHLVFGAIVRISGSGMGCGPHWPKCYGYWFPPFTRPDLVIEVMHRYLASILLLSLIGLLVAAWRRRAEAGVGGRGGVLRAAALATALGFSAAILGAVTVKLGNTPLATVAHWTVAMSLVAAVTACVIRAGGLGGASAQLGGASGKTRRGSFIGAALALVAVVMGGLTAKVAGGPVACLAFPLCGANPDVPRGAVHVQSTHRVIAVLLVLHLVGLFFALRKRNEAPVIRRAASIALGLGVLQLLVAGAMIGMKLPPVLRSLHEAVGVSIWIATFVLAYLSRIASEEGREGAVTGGAPRAPTEPVALPVSGRVVAGTPSAHASAAPASAPVAPPATPDTARAELVMAPVALVASPEPAAHGLAEAYRPPTPSAPMVAQASAVAEVIDAMPPARAEPLELPAAMEHGTRAALVAALAFHVTAAQAVAASQPVADDDRAAVVAEVVTEPVVAEPEVRAERDVMSAALAALAAGVPVAAADACIATGAVASLDAARLAGMAPAADAGDEVVAAPLVAGRDDVVEAALDVEVESAIAEAEAAGVRLGGEGSESFSDGDDTSDGDNTSASDGNGDNTSASDGNGDNTSASDSASFSHSDDSLSDFKGSFSDCLSLGSEVDEPVIARGVPPHVKDGTASAGDHHHPAARVTIFDRAEAGVDEVDDLYNLRELEALEDEDDAVAEHVLTLDEEFSLQASAVDEPEPAATVAGVEHHVLRTAVIPITEPAPVVAPAGAYTSLSAISSLRRPAMSHSIAVIVARGADF